MASLGVSYPNQRGSYHEHAPKSFNLLFAVVAVALVVPSSAQHFDGAWSITSWTSDGETNDDPQASLFVFHDGFYSWLSLTGTEERPKYAEGEDRDSVSHEKLHAIVLPVIANSGRYSVDGNKITLKPSVAISPNLMDGGQISFEFEKTDKKLVFTGGNISMTLKRQKKK